MRLTPRLQVGRMQVDLPVVAVLLLALALRLYNLTYHSLWLDETVTVAWARLPAAEIIARANSLSEDAHPALSYLVLRAWMLVFGDSEASLRGHTAVLGALLVLLIVLLGRSLAGRRVGLVGGLLAAINPYLIWYSQEVRMYALLAVLSAAGVWFLWRALADGRPHWWLGYLMTAVSAMYTVIIGALMVPVHLLVVLLAGPANRRRLATGVGAVVLAGLGFLPIAMNAWHSSGAIATERATPTVASLLTSTPVFLLLRQAPPPWQLLALPGIALAAVGALHLLRRCPRAAIILLGYLAIPLALIFALSVWRLPIFGMPYVIMAAAPLLMLAAAGIDALWQRRKDAGVAALAALCLVSVFALRHNWQRSMGKEDWRAAAQYIAAHGQPGDAILALPNYAAIPLAYYTPGNLPIVKPFGNAVSAEQIGPALQATEQYRTLWLVSSHGEQIDPGGLVRQWLIQRYPILTEQWPRGVEVRAFGVTYRRPAADDRPVAVFGGRLALLHADADASLAARDDVYHPPSGWVHVRLEWQRLADGNFAGLRVQARVIDSMGRVWGERLERPTEVWRFYPPQRWQLNEAVSDAYDINMNPVTPPGRYRVEIQVLDSSGKALPVDAAGMPADRYFVSEVEVR